MATRGLPASLCPLIVTIHEWSRTEVRSITILLLDHNAAGRAYLFGGRVCPSAQESNCTNTTVVEMLDMSLGAWQPFPVSLGRAVYDNDYTFQSAILDYELGACLRANGTVNDRLFR